MSRSALLVMDLQTSILERYGVDAVALLETVTRATTAARRHDIPVIYVRVAFRDGAPEISRRNKSFAARIPISGMEEANPASAIHSKIAPKEGDIVVTKRRVSAFSGSDLEVVLRSLEVTTLVLMGIATRGVVLSTVRQAADLDFQLIVLRDGCVDLDGNVQHVLMDVIFPRQSDVLMTSDWISSLEV